MICPTSFVIAPFGTRPGHHAMHGVAMPPSWAQLL